MARQGKSSRGGQRRFTVLFGLAAIGALLLALPAAAQNCIPKNQCTGTISGNYCVTSNGMGGFTNTPICASNAIQKPYIAYQSLFGKTSGSPGSVWYNPTDTAVLPDDPFADVTITRDKGTPVTPASGTFSSATPSSKTTDIGGGAGSALNLSNRFDLAANQMLFVDGEFRYDSLKTTFDPSALFPGIGSAGSAQRDIYTLHGTAAYRVGDTFFAVAATGDLGHTNATDNGAGATASYGTYGYQGQLQAGRMFTLFDSIRTAPSPSPWLPTKAAKAAKVAPKPVSGYAVHLILTGYTGYSDFQSDAFTDSRGVLWGTSQDRFWLAGGGARLYARIVDGGLIWRPFVAATLDQQFGFSGTLGIPAQAGAGADTLLFGTPQTTWTVRTGIDALNASGWDVGAQGLYQQSQQFNSVGAQLFLRYYPQPPK